MDYITTIQASDKWGITANRITILAQKNKINGAIKIGSNWMIPKDTPKPVDGRTKLAKETTFEASFRLPLFSGKDTNFFSPKLTDEELQLKYVEDSFFACHFDESEKLLNNLAETTDNIYIQIIALYFDCILSVMQNNPKKFFNSYGRFSDIFQKDFPYKKEMYLVYEELNATIGFGRYFYDKFIVDPEYNYHESFATHISAISALTLLYSNAKNLTVKDLNSYELNCKLLDTSNNPIDSQTTHFYLGFANFTLGFMDRSKYHYKRALEIARDYNLYFLPAEGYCFLSASIEPALAYFPDEFISKIHRLSNDVSCRYSLFTKNAKANNIFNFISQNKYLYLYYAVKNYSNKEIAKYLHLSEKTVSKNYSRIYTALGIKSKKELGNYYLNSIDI